MYNLPWPKPKKKNSVTLIAGIVCKDHIILAADGQTTNGSAKFLGANKITGIEFRNGKALVAEAGSAPLSAAAIDTFRRLAEAQTIENDLTIAKTCETAIREVVSGFTQHLGPKTSDQERQDFLFQNENYFELMVAYYHGFKPYIYHLKSTYAVPFPMPTSSIFTTTGIGADLANYILKEHTTPKMPQDLASVIAIKTVKDVAENVEGCGLPARIATISKPVRRRPFKVVPVDNSIIGKRVYGEIEIEPSDFYIFKPEKIDGIIKIVSRVESGLHEMRNKKFHAALQSQMNAYLKQGQRDLDKFFENHPEAAQKWVEELEKTGQAFEILPDEE